VEVINYYRVVKLPATKISIVRDTHDQEIIAREGF